MLDSGTLPDKDLPTEKISVNTIKDSRMDVIYISQSSIKWEHDETVSKMVPTCIVKGKWFSIWYE